MQLDERLIIAPIRSTKSGTPGPVGPQGPKGDAGKDGLPAEHRWANTSLQFKKPDGQWGQAVDLKGEKGDEGGGTSITVESSTGAVNDLDKIKYTQNRFISYDVSDKSLSINVPDKTYKFDWTVEKKIDLPTAADYTGSMAYVKETNEYVYHNGTDWVTLELSKATVDEILAMFTQSKWIIPNLAGGKIVLDSREAFLGVFDTLGDLQATPAALCISNQSFAIVAHPDNNLQTPALNMIYLFKNGAWGPIQPAGMIFYSNPAGGSKITIPTGVIVEVDSDLVKVAAKYPAAKYKGKIVFNYTNEKTKRSWFGCDGESWFFLANDDLNGKTLEIITRLASEVPVGISADLIKNTTGWFYLANDAIDTPQYTDTTGAKVRVAGYIMNFARGSARQQTFYPSSTFQQPMYRNWDLATNKWSEWSSISGASVDDINAAVAAHNTSLDAHENIILPAMSVTTRAIWYNINDAEHTDAVKGVLPLMLTSDTTGRVVYLTGAARGTLHPANAKLLPMSPGEVYIQEIFTPGQTVVRKVWMSTVAGDTEGWLELYDDRDHTIVRDDISNHFTNKIQYLGIEGDLSKEMVMGARQFLDHSGSDSPNNYTPQRTGEILVLREEEQGEFYWVTYMGIVHGNKKAWTELSHVLIP